MANPVRRFALISQSDGGSTLMFDLYLGLIALSLVSLIGFAISVRLPLRSSKRQGLLFMVVVLLAMGLYRGLKLKTAHTPFDVEVFSCSADQLRQLAPGWKILTVGIPRGADVNPIYERQYSWTPGTMPTALLYDFAPNDRVNMADPDVGREQWTTEDLRVLFRGQGMRLVRR